MAEALSYAKSGVNIDVTDAAKRQMARTVDRGDPRVLNRVGAFASLLEGRFEGYRHPILVMKTEEPGSKQKLALALGRPKSIGFDLVNHLVNDLMVMGTEPLYIQDCIVCGKIEPETVTAIVAGIADACREQGCVLCGGETSVQPGVVADGVYVLTACGVGVVDRERIIDGSRIREGDTVLALASNGLHTNGYTLVRKLLERSPKLGSQALDGETFMDVIMRPHQCYYKAVRGLFGDEGLKGMAHITGGGIQDNLNRILPRGLDAAVDLALLRVPPVFRLIMREGSVPQADMLRTFNMGAGLTAVCSPDAVGRFTAHLAGAGCAAYPIGRIVQGSQKVVYSGELKV